MASTSYTDFIEVMMMSALY